MLYKEKKKNYKKINELEFISNKKSFLPSIILIFLMVTGFFSGSCSTMSKKTGLIGNKFYNCPSSPNCVSSMEKRKSHQIDPIRYSFSRLDAFKRMIVVIISMKKVTIIKQTPSYIHAVFRTPLMNFADDVEFYFPENKKFIHVRSASRVGYSDMGVNRRRIDEIRKRFKSPRY